MAEVPLARTGQHAFGWTAPSTAAQLTVRAPLVAADPEGTRVQLPPAATLSLPIQAPVSASAWIRGHVQRLRAMDILLVLASATVGFLLAGGSFPLERSTAGSGTTITAIVVAATWIGALEVYRTRDRKVLGVGADEYKRVASASVRTFGVMAIAAVALGAEGAAAFVTTTLPLGLVALTANRWGFRRWLTSRQAQGQHLSNAIVVGEPEDVRYVIQRVVRKSGAVYNIHGVCLPGARRGTNFCVDQLTFPVLSSTDSIARAARLANADAVIVAGAMPGGNRFIRELGWKLEDSPAEMVLASTLTNVAGPRIHWRPVEGLPLMHVDIPQYSGGKHVLKRVLDTALALGALFVLSPVLAVLALIVRHDSPGPIFFRQERVGKNGTVFSMLKFRSMVVDAEARLTSLSTSSDGSGVLFKMRNDPRVTRCGRWMRKYSLDELPQLWNVVTGQMSMVGPRPPLAKEVSSYEQHTYRRLLTKPGITGLWQINGRSDLPWEEAVRLDLYYVENWSIAGDLLILWRTFRAVIRPSGAY